MSNDKTSNGNETTKVEEIKISVCGSGGVGKSAITYQYCFSKYTEIFDPTIEDQCKKKKKKFFYI